jgi:heat shock protein HslJ
MQLASFFIYGGIKPKSMKTLFFIALLYILMPANYSHAAEAACLQPGKTGMEDTTSLNGQWFLQPLLPADTAAGKIPELHINLSLGRFSGNTGCNTMQGSFEKTATSVIFSKDMTLTKMNCTGYNEAAFIKAC